MFLLSYPQTDFIIHTIRGPAQFHIGLSAAIFTMLLFALGVAFAFGMASTFKYIGDDFPDNMGRCSDAFLSGSHLSRWRPDCVAGLLEYSSNRAFQ